MVYGDFKLLAVFGAWLGQKTLTIIILLSSLVVAVIDMELIQTKKISQTNPILFGFYIAISG